jgi:hypothetical protein
LSPLSLRRAVGKKKGTPPERDALRGKGAF